MVTGAGCLGYEEFIGEQLPSILAAQGAVLHSPTVTEETNSRMSGSELASGVLSFIEALYPALSKDERSASSLELVKVWVDEERRLLENQDSEVGDNTAEELRRRHFLVAVIADSAGAENTTQHHIKALQKIRGPRGIAALGLRLTGELKDPYEIYFDTKDQEIKDKILAGAILRGDNFPIADKSVERNAAHQITNLDYASVVFTELCLRGDGGSLKPLEDISEQRAEELINNPDFSPDAVRTLYRELGLIFAKIEDAPVPERAVRTLMAAHRLLELVLPDIARKQDVQVNINFI